MTTINQAIKKLETFETKEQLRTLLADCSLSARMILLKEKMKSLDEEIEHDIQNEFTELAIFKLAQVVLLEEELSLVERLVLKTVERNL